MRRASIFVGLAAASARGGAGCRASVDVATPPRRSCAIDVWHRPAPGTTRVELATSWEGWRRTPLGADRADGWRTARVEPAGGVRTYAFVDTDPAGAETWATDDTVGTTAYATVEGVQREVSWLRVGDCIEPAIAIDAVTATLDGRTTIHARFVAGAAGPALDPASIAVRESDVIAREFSVIHVDATLGTFDLVGTLPVGKHVLSVRAKDDAGRDAVEALATAWVEPPGHRTWDWRDAVIYQVVVDRFRATDGGALPTPSVPSARAGGTLEGVRQAIESGELAALGVDALWLSPLYRNPEGTFPGSDGRPYAGYHGYWPIESRTLDPRLAGDGARGETAEQALDALVSAAHARGMRVLFDVVPNHVHAQHPYFIEHRRDGWFNHPDDACVCGTPTCDWGTHVEDCWFTPYLPDLQWRDPDVADQVSADVRWWIDRFQGDGVRIDAVPMMPRAANRRIAWELRAKYDHPGQRTFVLGENFVAADGWDFLRHELGPFGLDSEFDFPVMWALRSAIARRDGGLDARDATLRTSQSSWAGSGAVMAPMIGNHDVPRFASTASGDDGGDGWLPAPQPTDARVYAEQAMALGVVYTLPGAPVLYYGDEVGLAGRGDPDTRRPMPAESSLLPAQRALREVVRRLGRARGCSVALRRGAYRSLGSDADHLVYAREADGETALVAIARDGDAAFDTPLPGIAAGTWVDALSGATLEVTPARTRFEGKPLTFQLYFPGGSACLAP
ncbi:MAG: hypothetical protein NVS3B10_05150 [Polyangiales bacterium]